MKWEYTLETIAKASGASLHTVRDHKQSGRLDPGNLWSVAKYIVAQRLLRMK